MATSDGLTLQGVADRLGVHYQTVYRWVRSGRLEASKVAGSYVVEPATVDAFERERRRPAAPPKPTGARLDRRRAAMATALVEGDETTAQRIARELVSNGASITELIGAVIVPPLVEIGERWHAGEFGIYVEHRATAIVERMIGELAPNPRGRRRGSAVVAALSGDRHSLPTAMATAAFREDNWAVEHLGADMPVDEIIGFAERHDVDLVVLSATGDPARKRARRARKRIESQTGLPVLVGETGKSVADLQTEARAVDL